MAVKITDRRRSSQPRPTARDAQADATISRIATAPGGMRAGPFTKGGLINPTTGMGIAGPDKLAGTWFQPTIFGARVILDAIYGESWAAQKLIDIIPDDIWARGRRWIFEKEEGAKKGEPRDKAAAKKWDRLLKKWQVAKRIRQCHKRARLYGTGMIAILTSDGAPDQEFDVENMRPNTLRNLLPMDRYDTEIEENYLDPRDPMFGEPSMYRYTPRIRATRGTQGPLMPGQENHATPFRIHASRVLRIDGAPPPSVAGWEGYEPWWGLSFLVKAVNDIGREMMAASAGAQMAEEASIPILKTENGRTLIRQAQRGQMTFDGASLQEILESASNTKSVYRTMVLDSKDDFDRVTINFAGFADVMDRYPERLAFIGQIPITRFLARSPAGMQATGESDRANYSMEVETQRDRQIQDVADRIDMVIARNDGMAEPPEHEWPSLYEASDKERAEVRGKEVETISVAVNAGIISEDTGADLMRDLDDMYAEIPEAPEPEPIPEPLDPNMPPEPGGPEPPPNQPPEPPPDNG